MKTPAPTILAAAAGAAWLALGQPDVHAQSVGVQFVGDTSGNGGHIDTSAADALPPAATAGAPPHAQMNWNNLGRWGDSITLNDSAGAATGLFINWDATRVGVTGSAGFGTPDGELMDGYIYCDDTGAAEPPGNSVYGTSVVDKPLIFLSGLQDWLNQKGASSYQIALYITGYADGEESEFWVESASGNPLASAMIAGPDLTPHYFNTDTANFWGSYSQATSTNSSSPTVGANYVAFTGLTNDAVLLRCQSDGNYGMGINGFQVIPIYSSPLVVTPPTFSPSASTYADSPVGLTEAATGEGMLAYQWQTDGGGTGGLTNIPGATATNLLVIPPDRGSTYAINYAVIVSNSSLSATSAVVTLTVNAATAPILLQDISPATNTYAYVGSAVTFSAAFDGTQPIAYQWLSNSVAIPGATNPALTLANVPLSAAATYLLAATNAIGGTTSSAAVLTVQSDPPAPVAASQPYFNLVYTNQPWAYWRLNETNNPTTFGAPAYIAYDLAGHGFGALYGNDVTVGNPGPGALTNPGYTGFDTNELAAGTTVGAANSYLTAPALNLSGNTNVTFMIWINPNGPQASFAGLLFNRGGGDTACGFGFGGDTNELGYTWNNNNPDTWNWPSGLYVATNQWNFVAYVITPTNTTVYLGNLSGATNFTMSINPVANSAETFSGGTILLGSDPQNTARNFNGLLTEASLFTNALTYDQVRNYFLVGIGGAELPPTVFPATASPSANVYSGQNVLLNAIATSPGLLGVQWQAGPDGSTWTNVPGATAASLLINPQTVGTSYYQLVATNSAGSSSSGAIGVTFNPLPATPAGLWTMNFQVTNNLDASHNIGSGIGHYLGRGVVGDGMYWNVLPDLLASTNTDLTSNLTSISDLRDDGATHSGIYCHLNAVGGKTCASALPDSDIGNLLEQYGRTYYSNGAMGQGALQFFGVPDGTYNLVVFSAAGTCASQGATFVVFDPRNGNQTNSTMNGSVVPSETALAQGDNFLVFTNVHVAGGTLNVDVLANTNAAAGGEADLNGAQLQLVSYDVPAPAVMLNGTLVAALGATNGTMTLSWPEGLLQMATNLLGPWTPLYVPAPFTVPATNSAQFYRVQIP